MVASSPASPESLESLDVGVPGMHHSGQRHTGADGDQRSM